MDRFLQPDKLCADPESPVDHVVFHYPIYQRPHEAHGLTVLDDETIKCLLNTCPEIYCG